MSYTPTGFGIDINVDVPGMTNTAINQLLYRMPEIVNAATIEMGKRMPTLVAPAMTEVNNRMPQLMASVAKQMPTVLQPVGPWVTGPLWQQIQPKIRDEVDHITKVAVGIGLVAALGAGGLGLYLYKKKRI